MTSYSKDSDRVSWSTASLPWPQTRRIMSAYKDDDRFFKVMSPPCRTGWPGRTAILLPVGERLFICRERRRGRVTRCECGHDYRRLPPELEAGRGDSWCATRRRLPARGLPDQRPARPRMDGDCANSSVPTCAVICMKSKPAPPAIRWCMTSNPILKGFMPTGSGSRCRGNRGSTWHRSVPTSSS
jgi:hypothetical protein